MPGIHSKLLNVALVAALVAARSAVAQEPPAAETPAVAPPAAETAPPAEPAATEPAPTPPAEVAKQEDTPGVDAAPPPARDYQPKPPPYSLPWQLRSVVPANVVRLDTSFAFYEAPDAAPNAGESGSTIVSFLFGSYKVIPELAVLGRIGLVNSSPPDGTNLPMSMTPVEGKAVVTNPLLGALFGPKITPNLKVAAFLGITLPIGGGGGDPPDPEGSRAIAAGAPARAAFDNAMFATQYLSIIPGIDVAYLVGGFTIQGEVTLFKLIKARGPDTIDSHNTNMTLGLHAGYFVIPQLSIGAEIRHRRWLSTPAAVKADTTDTLRDDTNFAIGPRAHFKLGETTWFRPGVSFGMPFDKPMSDSKYKIVQLDLPFAF